MGKLAIISNIEELQKPQWVTFDLEGFGVEGDADPVEFQLRPQTRTVIAQIEKRLKGKKLLRDDEELNQLGDMGSRGEMFVREMADHILVDWRNVVDAQTKEPLPCDARMKLFLFENVDVALWIIDRAKKLAAVRYEEELKN